MFGVGDQKVPIMFPECLIHADVARHVQQAIDLYWKDSGRKGSAPKVLSAGFISAMAVTGVHGQSDSMDDLPHNPQDARTINAWPYEYGRAPLIPNTEALVRARVAQLLVGVG